MANPTRRGAGLRLLLMMLLWALVPTTAAAHVHQAAASSDRTWTSLQHLRGVGDLGPDVSQWEALPLHCGHCRTGASCDRGGDCTPGGLPLLATPLAVAFLTSDQAVHDWTPDRPLAENPTPPIPPPLQIL